MTAAPRASNTWDCLDCEQTYWAVKGTTPPYLCDFCGQPLRQRRENVAPADVYEPQSYYADADEPGVRPIVTGAAQLPLFTQETQ